MATLDTSSSGNLSNQLEIPFRANHLHDLGSLASNCCRGIDSPTGKNFHYKLLPVREEGPAISLPCPERQTLGSTHFKNGDVLVGPNTVIGF